MQSNSNLLEKMAIFGPYCLIFIGIGACILGSHFHWASVESLGGQAAASGFTLMVQQTRAVLNNKEGGQINIGNVDQPAQIDDAKAKK